MTVASTLQMLTSRSSKETTLSPRVIRTVECTGVVSESITWLVSPHSTSFLAQLVHKYSRQLWSTTHAHMHMLESGPLWQQLDQFLWAAFSKECFPELQVPRLEEWGGPVLLEVSTTEVTWETMKLCVWEFWILAIRMVEDRFKACCMLRGFV